MLGRTKVLQILFFICLSSPSAFGIQCTNEYQRVNGQLIATPYCGDEYLAKVARGYGLRVTASQLRNNPNFKKEICRTVFRDNRVSLICEAAGIPDWRR